VYADFFPEPMRARLMHPFGTTPRAQILELEEAAHAVPFEAATQTTEAFTASAVVVATAQRIRTRAPHPALDLVQDLVSRNLSSFGELFFLRPAMLRRAQDARHVIEFDPRPRTFTGVARHAVASALDAGFRDRFEVPDFAARRRLVAALETTPVYGSYRDVCAFKDGVLGNTATYFELARPAAITFCPDVHAVFRTLAPPGAARILSLAAPQPQARADGRHPWDCPDRSHAVIASALAVRTR
jgi:hypothetical protein